MKRVLFVQLPPPRFVFQEAPSNIPLAGGFLLCALRASKIAAIEAELVGPEIVDVFCDQGLVERICEGMPSILALSLYVWNAQKSLFVASAIKNRLPDVRIVVGGPEVTPDNHWVLEHPAVDAGVFGEGESRIGDAIEALCSGADLGGIPGIFYKSAGGIRVDRENADPWDLSRCSYPYLNSTIVPSLDGTLFLETVRGCPFRCRYCYYHKAFGEVRRHPLSTILRVLDKAYASESGVREIYLMDPTFNAHSEFRALLRYIVSLRSGEYPTLHTELRADLLTVEDVKLLSEAGLASAEIGLQTTNPRALKLAGRSGSPAKTAHGVNLLKQAGIEVTTGIIVGLPGDSPKGFTSTLEWLTATEAYSVVHPFLLSVLPGTDFRVHAKDLGLNYSLRPPYYVQSTNTFGRQDLRAALHECEETFGMEIDYIAPPSFIDRGPGLIRGPDEVHYVSKWILDVDSVKPSRLLARVMVKATDPFTFWFRGCRLEDSETVVLSVLRRFTEANPHTVIRIILEFDSPPERSFFDKAIDVTSHPGAYLNRTYEPLYGEGSIVTPIFELLWPDPGLSRARDAIQATYGSVATLVWEHTEADRRRLLKAEPPLLISCFEPQIDFREEAFIGLLYDMYRAHPDDIRFRDPLLQDYWESLTHMRQPTVMLPEKILISA